MCAFRSYTGRLSESDCLKVTQHYARCLLLPMWIISFPNIGSLRVNCVLWASYGRTFFQVGLRHSPNIDLGSTHTENKKAVQICHCREGVKMLQNNLINNWCMSFVLIGRHLIEKSFSLNGGAWIKLFFPNLRTSNKPIDMYAPQS